MKVRAMISGENSFPITGKQTTLKMDVANAADYGNDATLAKMFYHAVMAAAARKECVDDERFEEMKTSIGVKQELNARFVTYAGATLTQMVVNALANENNKGMRGSPCSPPSPCLM